MLYFKRKQMPSQLMKILPQKTVTQNYGNTSTAISLAL